MRILTLSLDLPLHPGDIPAFRSCIAGLAGREHEIFHNHDAGTGENDRYHWGYPRVQYVVRRGRATLIGLDAGAEAIRRILLPQLPYSLHFAGRAHKLGGYQMQEKIHEVVPLERPRQYGLFGWIALNRSNYTAWKIASEEAERLQILSRALTGHLRAFAQTVGGLDLQQISGEVLSVGNQKRIAWHSVPLIRFHVHFQTNLKLPTGIGIGRSAAFGFGEALPLAAYKKIVPDQRAGVLKTV